MPTPRDTENLPIGASSSPDVVRRRHSGDGSIVDWPALDSLTGILTPPDPVRRSTDVVIGLLDVFSIGMVGAVRRALFTEEREELRAELTRARQGIQRMEERDHELRNAVEGVRVLVSLLDGGAGPGRHDEADRQVSSVTRSELCRIGELLERGAEPGPVEDYLVAPVVEAVVLAHGAGLSVEIDVPLELTARGSPSVLTHVVSNLLSNCRRYAAGSPVRVRARQRSGGLWLEVSDDGARREPHPAPTGLGIGLSVSRRLLRADGGWIDPIEFRPDGGCTVRVGLRAAP